MSNVKRVFVEKKPEFAVAAKELGHEIRHYLGITDVTGVRVLIRYVCGRIFLTSARHIYRIKRETAAATSAAVLNRSPPAKISLTSLI